MPVIGLAGGIGSGKTLVARQLAQLGCAVIDSDLLARQMLDEPACRAQIVRRWGDRVVGADGAIDRKALAAIVFADDAQLRSLEAIIHPAVHRERARLREEYACNDSILAIVEDCPLLFEKGLDAECDVTIFVASSRATRLRRVAASRGWSERDLVAREKMQWELDIKAQRADYVVSNDADEADCLRQVSRILSQILHR